jgi:hypothetical protein
MQWFQDKFLAKSVEDFIFEQQGLSRLFSPYSPSRPNFNENLENMKFVSHIFKERLPKFLCLNRPLPSLWKYHYTVYSEKFQISLKRDEISELQCSDIPVASLLVRELVPSAFTSDPSKNILKPLRRNLTEKNLDGETLTLTLKDLKSQCRIPTLDPELQCLLSFFASSFEEYSNFMHQNSELIDQISTAMVKLMPISVQPVSTCIVDVEGECDVEFVGKTTVSDTYIDDGDSDTQNLDTTMDICAFRDDGYSATQNLDITMDICEITVAKDAASMCAVDDASAKITSKFKEMHQNVAKQYRDAAIEAVNYFLTKDVNKVST